VQSIVLIFKNVGKRIIKENDYSKVKI